MASGDRIAIDVEATKVIESFEGNNLDNINPWDLEQIKDSVENNIGVSSEQEYDVLEG